MTLDEIKEVIKLMSENDLTEFHIDNDGFSLNLKRGSTSVQPVAVPAQAVIPQSVLPQAAVVPQMSPVGASAVAYTSEVANEKLKAETIDSPCVGTFYLAPAPDAKPYVEVGTHVTADTTVGVVEAMKVMNEIKAEKEGVIKEILVKNASPVEYGQHLFVIE